MKALIFCFTLLLASNSFSQEKFPVIGQWEGESVCQVPKPCTTEHVIYDITAANSGKLTIKADKVVNGQREWMGDLSCTWSDEEKKLSCPMEGRKPGDWVFWLKGDRLIGTLTVRDTKAIFRKIDVRRKAN